MSRFLICTMPITGHVNPGIPLAEALMAHGHQVGWYTGRKFRAAIEATGAQYFPMEAAYDFDDSNLDAAFPSDGQARGLTLFNRGLKRLFIDPIPGQVADLQGILRTFPADVLIVDTMFFGAEALHELGGPPWATFGISAMTISSRDTAPFMSALPPSSTPLGRIRNRLLTAFFNKVMFRQSDQHLDLMRRRLGLGPADHHVLDTLSPYLYMQSGAPAFEYPRSDLPPQVHFVGPLLPRPPASDTRPPWWSDVHGNRPVVLVTQGTIATESADLLRPTIEALADEDLLVIATTGGKPADTLGLDLLPANARVAPFIPYGALMPHLSLMITNGGYGGVLFGLAHGVPLIVAGTTEEKPEIAARVAWSGAGLNLKTKAPTHAQIQAAVRAILADGSYRQAARRIAQDFARYDAALLTVALLERLARTRQPVYRAAPVMSGPHARQTTASAG